MQQSRSLRCTFSDIMERDMDMLFLEELISSKEFLQLFLTKINIDDAEIIAIEHSKKDAVLGETDMTVILENNDGKFAVLIEDKIDAIAMSEQASRYFERGNKGIANGEYERYYVFIAAPKAYLDSNKEASKYPNKIAYEEVLTYFEKQNNNRAAFKAYQIRQAISKKESGYQPIEHPGVTDFWEKYVAYQKKYYPRLLLASSAGKKGSAASWPRYRTKISGLYMLHKSEFGCIDLTFESAKEQLSEIDKLLKDIFGSYESIGATITITGKSVALRLQVPVLNFKESFEEQVEKIEECFVGIDKMTTLANKLDDVRVINILHRCRSQYASTQ